MTLKSEPAMVKELVMDALAVGAGIGLLSEDLTVPGWVVIGYAAVSAVAQWFGVREQVASPETYQRLTAERQRAARYLNDGGDGQW